MGARDQPSTLGWQVGNQDPGDVGVVVTTWWGPKAAPLQPSAFPAPHPWEQRGSQERSPVSWVHTSSRLARLGRGNGRAVSPPPTQLPGICGNSWAQQWLLTGAHQAPQDHARSRTPALPARFSSPNSLPCSRVQSPDAPPSSPTSGANTGAALAWGSPWGRRGVQGTRGPSTQPALHARPGRFHSWTRRVSHTHTCEPGRTHHHSAHSPPLHLGLAARPPGRLLFVLQSPSSGRGQHDPLPTLCCVAWAKALPSSHQTGPPAEGPELLGQPYRGL